MRLWIFTRGSSLSFIDPELQFFATPGLPSHLTFLMATETNALAGASSAYLRSAMHQPIHWHEWGEDAFATAQRENKPILLDIGAVWCHWCHVMDRESYENADLAGIINEHFVAVKVDRDERPDVDSRYQAAVQAISGQGGWPLTVFLTPDGRPFFGGTYFPPDDHLGRPGFRRVLQAIAEAYRSKHGDVIESADNVMAFISQAESFTGGAGPVSVKIVDSIVASAKSMFDPEHGGFGTAPKFPHPSAMDLLLQRYVATNDPVLRDIVIVTLTRMASGGVYDQLGGGFHRYSVDERWVVPHFEKMSYDNSELLKNYVHAFQATGIQQFADVARDMIRWMDNVLSDREHGGFYASQDADISLDDDGDYFTWTRAEAKEVLTEEEFSVASMHYDIGETGEMHHNHLKNVLFVSIPVEEIAKRLNVDPARASNLLASAKRKMYQARLERPTPYVDKTVYVGWNGLCISAYLAAARVLSLEDARRFALRSLDRILSQAWRPERGLAHVLAYSDAAAEQRSDPGMLDDYAFTAIACLDAYEATSDLTYFQFAERIANAMIERFYDAGSGGFFDAAPGQALIGALVARRKPLQDSPTPAGNPSAAIALIRLYNYTNDNGYRDRAQRTLELFAGNVEQYGLFAATYALAVVSFTRGHTQVVVVGNDSTAQQMYAEAVAPFSVTTSVLRLTDSEAAPQYLTPALRETIPNLPAVREGKTVAVICSEFTCRPPVTTPEELGRQLRDIISGRQESSAAD